MKEPTMVTMTDLSQTAAAMVAPGKGILAADERGSTMQGRLEAVGAPGNEQARRAWRDLILTTPGLSGGVSGIILSDETFNSTTLDGTAFPRKAAQLGILAGIKVDAGTTPLPGSASESMTQGLDGLRERLAAYREAGAAFAKWRAVIRIDPLSGLPSTCALSVNAHALARYAALCHEAGIVPIVEPEVLMAGQHTIEDCEEATARILRATMEAMTVQDVALDAIVLKPNMVAAGLDRTEPCTDQQVAAATLRCLRRHVPATVGGIAFLSGGQSPKAATSRLRAINAQPQPWALTYSFGRALLAPALHLWAGVDSQVDAAQDSIANRVAAAAAARDHSEAEAVLV
ncbi:MAG: class I fructose-bisphosphate aldolase [Euzebya sp.]